MFVPRVTVITYLISYIARASFSTTCYGGTMHTAIGIERHSPCGPQACYVILSPLGAFARPAYML